VIIATAGHVDHGKTSLIRQLTGVETDRLEEEKRRGLSITNGFAYLARPGEIPLGFIDVPGHQRFMNNMIAGISGIDTGLLVIAADDGPMPQTHEHMDVLELLGVDDLIVVISKIDRVDGSRLAALEQDITDMLARRPWTNSSIFFVSSIDGAGIDALKAALLDRAEQSVQRSSTGRFRLSIDRVFSVKGAGLIVTGTAAAGRIGVGDTLKLLPENVEVRIRGIRVHDQHSDTALAGQRCALNLVGKLDAASVEKGDWLVQPGAAPSSTRMDVQFSMLSSAPFALKNHAPIKLHIGAKRIAGRIVFLDSERANKQIHPGSNCLAQLLLESEVSSHWRERFLLRDHAENVILGGGIVLDPLAPRSGKSRQQRMTFLKAMSASSVVQALSELMTQNQLINMDRFGQSCNLMPDEVAELAVASGRIFSAEGTRWMVSVERWKNTRQDLLGVIDKWHAREPERPGIKITELGSALAERIEPALLMAVMTDQLHKKMLSLNEGRISRSNFKATENTVSAGHWQEIETVLQRCGNRIPLLSQLAEQLGIEQERIEQVMKTAVKQGRARKLSPRRYALRDTLYALAGQLIDASNKASPLTVIAMKSHFDTGRNLTVEILEYFDAIHFTARRDNERVVLDPELPARLFKG
jgi:selenocysteine-specific elongation factor